MLGPYFHSLYHILKFVDDRQLPMERADERPRYTNFVRARLSFSELIILFYGGLSQQGGGMRRPHRAPRAAETPGRRTGSSIPATAPPTGPPPTPGGGQAEGHRAMLPVPRPPSPDVDAAMGSR
jgi:hypothetical protein